MTTERKDGTSEQSPHLREDEHKLGPGERASDDHDAPPDKTPAFEDDAGEVYTDEDP